MADLEYDMVLARPGFNKKYNRDVTWDELRKTFLLYKRIPMIAAAGSHSGPIDPNVAVGIVDAKIDDDAQTIRGKGVFFKERFQDVPPEVQKKLAYKEYVPASLGYEQFGNLRKVDHLLVGAQSPVFPDIGFNAEDSFRYEETDGLNADAKETPVEPDTAKDTEIQSLRSEIAELKALFLKAQEPPPQDTEDKPVAVEAQETGTETNDSAPTEAVLQVTDPPPPPPRVEAERTFPKSPPSSTQDGWQEDEFGRRFMSFKVAGTDDTKPT